MRLKKLLILSALFASALLGQGGGGVVIQPVATLPGFCTVNQVFLYQGTLYTCPSGTPVSGGGGGSGTVTTSGSPAANTFSMFTAGTVIGNGPLSTDGTTLSSTEPFSALKLIAGSGTSATGGVDLAAGTSSNLGGNPASGSFTLFLNSGNSNHLSTLSSTGSVADLQGSGGGAWVHR